MDRLEAMGILMASLEEGSFSAAGRKLGLPLPTVSRKISELENHLGARLLVRSTRKLSLTEAGAAYVTAAKRILDEVHEAEAQAAGEYGHPRGELTLTAPIVFGRLHVLPIIAAFLAEYLDVTVRLTLSDRNLDLIDEHIDLAIRIGSLPDSNMVATNVGYVRRVVCASPAYFERHGVPLTPEDLPGHIGVAFSGFPSPVSWPLQVKGRPLYVQPRHRLHVNTAEAAIDAAIADAGITSVLSYQVAHAVKAGTLKLALTAFEPAPFPVHLVHAHSRLVPQKMRTFLAFAAPRLRASVSAVEHTIAVVD